MLPGYQGVLLFLEAGVDVNALGLLDDVRDIVVPAVGDGGAEVGKVHRRCQDLSLTYGKGDDRGGIPPAFAVGPVVGFGRGNAAGPLRREVAAQLAPEAEAHHHLPPVVKAVGDVVILLVVQYVLEHVAVVRVAGHHYGFLHIQGALVHVAARLVAGSEVVALAAGIGHFRAQHTLFKADEPVHQLEHGPRRV